jgi:hypothetical protein
LRHSFNEDVPAATGRQAEWWWAINNNIVVDLDDPGTAMAPVPAPAVKKEEASSSSFEFGSDDDGADFSAFGRH